MKNYQPPPDLYRFVLTRIDPHNFIDWPKVAKCVTLRQSREARRIRRGLTDQSRLNFIDTALSSLDKGPREAILQQLEKWDVHHVIPISLGGDNDWLALVRKSLHKNIHEYIDSQVRDLAVGASRVVSIPVWPGLVWAPIESPQKAHDLRAERPHTSTQSKPVACHTL